LLTAEPLSFGRLLWAPPDTDNGIPGGLMYRDDASNWPLTWAGLEPRPSGQVTNGWMNDLGQLDDVNAAVWRSVRSPRARCRRQDRVGRHLCVPEVGAEHRPVLVRSVTAGVRTGVYLQRSRWRKWERPSDRRRRQRNLGSQAGMARVTATCHWSCD
jgi:hypothetical protein